MKFSMIKRKFIATISSQPLKRTTTLEAILTQNNHHQVAETKEASCGTRVSAKARVPQLRMVGLHMSILAPPCCPLCYPWVCFAGR